MLWSFEESTERPGRAHEDDVVLHCDAHRAVVQVDARAAVQPTNASKLSRLFETSLAGALSMLRTRPSSF